MIESLKNRVVQIIKRSDELFLSDIVNAYSEKSESNLITSADYQVQDFLTSELCRLLPNSRVLSEENTGSHDIKLNKESGYIWVIDPIDGTTNFVHRHPHYCTSVSLFHNDEIVLGVIYSPSSNELFHAIAGEGAFLNGNRIFTSTVIDIHDSLIGFGFPYDKTKVDAILSIVRRVIDNVHDLRRTGSASLDLAYVSCGRLDGYFEFDLEIWDYSAGCLILKEAGGRIANWEGDENLRYCKSDIIATNTFLYKQLLEYLK